MKAVKPTIEWQFSGGIVFYSGGPSEVSTILNISVGIMTLAFWGSYCRHFKPWSVQEGTKNR
jgi:hypothetical protein